MPLTSCTFVLFGATGDLTRRKLLPALFRLFNANSLPERFAIVGFALPDKKTPDYHEFVRAAIHEFIPDHERAEHRVEQFIDLTSFVAANFTDAEGYERLKTELARVDAERGTFGNHLYYMATPTRSRARDPAPSATGRFSDAVGDADAVDAYYRRKAVRDGP
jgi:glucose-6-phosphate 1-dehydrogenase